MANITSRGKSWLLVEYRPTPGGKKKRWRCPDEKTFQSFCELERIHKDAGTPVPDPKTVFGEVPRGKTSSEEPSAAFAGPTADPVRPEETQSAGTEVPSLGEWLGEPSAGKPGPFFDYAKKMGDAQRRRYESLVNQYGAHFRDKPMSEVTLADAKQMMTLMIVCEACQARASAAGRSDLLADPAATFDVTREPWDGACADEEGDDTHVARNKRETVIANLWLMRNVWRTAREAATLGLDPRFAALTSLPFEKVGSNVPQVPERQTNDDLAEALSHAQLERLRLGFPEWLRPSVRVATYGLLRRSELLGLERAMITWPTLPEHKGQAVIIVSHTLVSGSAGQATRRPWGKNRHSTREPVYLSALATEELRAHVDAFRSNPNPDVCRACAGGLGEHQGPAKTNPHRGCDFAADAPIWWDPERNERVTPRDYSTVWFERAAEAAGLTVDTIGFRPTPKLMRATGATLLIDSGVPIEQVARMGRWKNPNVLRKHYHRMREASRALAAQALDFAARGELGIEGTGEASLEDRVRFLARRVEVLEGQLADREQLLADLGFDVNAVDEVEPGQKWDVHARRQASPFADIDRLRELAATCRNRREILEKLGLSDGGASRLIKVAKANGIELPKPWQRKPGKLPPRELLPVLTDERLASLAADHSSVSAILAALGVHGSPANVGMLKARAAEVGVVLPDVQARRSHDYSVLDDEDRFRAAAAEAGSLLDVVRRLGLDTKNGYCQTMVRERAAELGVDLPAGRGRQRRRSDRLDFFADDEAIVAAVTGAASRKEVLRRLGIESQTDEHRRLLVEHAERLGLDLPPLRGSGGASAPPSEVAA